MCCEEFGRKEKIKGLCLSVAFFLFIVFGGRVLKRTNITFLIENMNFVVYGGLFVTAVSLFWNTYVSSVKECFCDSKKKFRFWVIATTITIAGMVIAAILLDKTGIANQNQESIEAVVAKGGITGALMGVAAVVFGPVVEETVYRFFIFRFFRSKFRILSHILVAALFGFWHVAEAVLVAGDVTQLFFMLPYVVASIGCSVSYVKTKSLAFPILLHMVINFMAFTS